MRQADGTFRVSFISEEAAMRAALCVDSCKGISDEEVKGLPSLKQKYDAQTHCVIETNQIWQDKCDGLKAQLAEARDTITRLASANGFIAIGVIPDNMWGEEIKARMKYADAFLDKAGS